MDHSAGILIYDGVSVLLGHPGGPYYKNNEFGVWSMPKGCFDPERETPRSAALREFREETGVDLGEPKLAALDPMWGKHKTLYPFLLDLRSLPGDVVRRLKDVDGLKCNTCEIEFRGKTITIPEVDRYRWCNLGGEAQSYISQRQVPLLDRVLQEVAA